MSSNKNKYGANIYPGYAFVAPNAAFESPIMEIPVLDAQGQPTAQTEFVSIKDYFALEMPDSAFSNRKVIPLKGGTHSFGMFDMSAAKGDFDKNKTLMQANGLKDSKDDFLDADPTAAFMLSYSELVEFLDVSPLNVEPEIV